MCECDLSELERLTSENIRLQAIIDEWGIGGEPPIRIDIRKLETTHYLRTGDTFNLSINDEDGDTLLMSHAATRIEQHTIDSVAIFRMTDALGFKIATMGVFGEIK